MDIKVLGSGCSSCSQLFSTVVEAVDELNLDIDVQFIADVSEVLSYEVLQMPALVIDEKVVSYGKDLSISEVKIFLTKQ